MYIVRIGHVPALGKGAQLRAALEEHSKASKSAGGAYGVSVRIYAPEIEFINSYTVESLKDLDAYNATFASDTGRQARLNKINECLVRPQAQELSEIIVASQPTEPVSYNLQVTFHVAPGKGPEVAQLLETGATQTVKGRIGAAVRTPVVATDGPSFTIVNLFASLAGLEEYRLANRADSSFMERAAKLATLADRPLTMELYRVLMARP